MVKGVLFDMDGTMLDTEPVSERCWKKSAAECGYTIDDELMKSICGKNLESIKDMLENTFGITDEAVSIIEGRQYYYRKYVVENEIEKKKGLVELLEYLKDKNIPMAVCTSTERNTAEVVLKKSGIYGYFKGYVYGDMVTRTKPDPQGYHMAAEAIGVEPGNCLVVEDSPNGVLAGKAAGGYTIYIQDTIEIDNDVKNGITAEMNNLSDIIHWIEQENGICMK